MGLGQKEDKRKERGKKRGDSAMRYCYAAKLETGLIACRSWGFSQLT
jgi:hypothetical protein